MSYRIHVCYLPTFPSVNILFKQTYKRCLRFNRFVLFFCFSAPDFFCFWGAIFPKLCTVLCHANRSSNQEGGKGRVGTVIILFILRTYVCFLIFPDNNVLILPCSHSPYKLINHYVYELITDDHRIVLLPL